MKVVKAKPARLFKVARKHIIETIDRCLTGGGGPVEVDFGKYTIHASGYRQVGKPGTTGVRVVWSSK